MPPSRDHLHIRRIRPGDGPALREIRLRALREDPAAFASTYEREVDRPPDTWESFAAAASAGTDQATFFAELDGHIVAMAGAYRPDDRPRTLHLVAMWVAPEARGRGAGVALVQQVVEWARGSDADELTLWVVDGNEAARRTYERAGFAMTEIAQQVPGDPSRLEHLMRLDLGRSGPELPPGYVEFAPMTTADFDAYLEWAVASLAGDLMEAENADLARATAMAAAQIQGLLPAGEATPGMHLATLRLGMRDEPAGWIWFGTAGSGEACMLYDLVVFGPLRGRGVGSAALDELEEWARRTGLAQLVLHVWEHNERARRFFERHGYEAAATAPGHVMMEKRLGTSG